ncbi:MAG: inositol monophosphatase [Planctomycetaceae bacterium]|nr:inositol monophosphatase [Planctomycetaceae bacterium]
MSKFLEVCEQAARAGGRVLLDWQGKFAIREKGPSDLVTEADLAAQQEVKRILLGQFADHAFLGEEGFGSEPEGYEYRWIVDPLDGTVNYVHGLSNYCVSVALERRGELLAATIFAPESNECYTAEAGQGAWLNGRPIRTSACRDLSQALVAASFPPQTRRGDPELEDFIEVLQGCRAIRRFGSAALNLCYVAAGKLDGFWSTNIHIWDVAAGILLVREAGGKVASLNDSPVDMADPKFISAATPQLFAALRRQLPSARTSAVRS